VFIREGKFNCTNICGTLIPNKNPKLSLEYMALAVQESSQHNKRIDTNGAKIMSNEMAVINIVFPPFQEQVEIAEYIKLKIDTISNILKNLETQITTLKELRKTLINEVVTGKVKVSSDLQ
jgi:type I restriction enzyme S subunit